MPTNAILMNQIVHNTAQWLEHCPLLLLASSLIWTWTKQFNMHHHAITLNNHYAHQCNDLDQTVHNTAQRPEHYIFCSFMHHPLIWVTNSNLTLVSQTSNLPQQCNNCRCPLHHSHLPRYYPAKPATRNIHTFQLNTNFRSPPITYEKHILYAGSPLQNLCLPTPLHQTMLPLLTLN